MVNKQGNRHYSLVPISIISSALKEDPISTKMIPKYYHGHMTKLCLKSGLNEVGRLITYADEYMLRQLETKLVEAILKSKVS